MLNGARTWCLSQFVDLCSETLAVWMSAMYLSFRCCRWFFLLSNSLHLPFCDSISFIFMNVSEKNYIRAMLFEHLNIEFDVRHSTNQNTSIKFNQKKRKHVSCLVIRSRSHIIDQTRKSRKIHFFLLHSHLKIAVDLFHLKVGREKRQLIKNEKRWMFWYVCQSVFIFAVYWFRYDIIFREIELVHCDTDFCHLLSFSNRFLLICTSGLFPFMWHSWTACNMDSVLKVTTQLTRSILFFIFALSRIRHFNSLMNIFI